MTTDMEGIALMLVMGLIGIALLVGALCIERLIEPRHERLFRNLASNTRGRRAMAEDCE